MNEEIPQPASQEEIIDISQINSNLRNYQAFRPNFVGKNVMDFAKIVATEIESKQPSIKNRADFRTFMHQTLDNLSEENKKIISADSVDTIKSYHSSDIIDVALSKVSPAAYESDQKAAIEGLRDKLRERGGDL